MTDQDETVVARVRAVGLPRPHGPGPDLEDLMRAGAVRRERRARRGAAATASGVTALLVGAVVLGTGVLWRPGPTPVAGDPEAAWEQLALLAEPAGPDDVLPDAAVGVGDLLLERPTVRLVAEEDGVAYFAGTDAAGAVCVLVHQRRPAEGTVQSCLSPEDFEDIGLGFGFSWAEGEWVRGVLVPDSWSFDDPDDRVMSAVSPGSGLSLDDEVTPNLLARVTGAAEAPARDG